MTRPTITVAIPSYNKEKFIGRCIDSVISQSDPADRIILIDNASADQTFSIAQSYAEAVACIQNDTNIGQVPNWNRCIETCDTNWLLILHADDELLPNALKDYRKIICKNPSIGLIHADSMIQQEGAPETREYARRSTYGIFKAGMDALSCEYGVCSTVLVKREAYEKLGKFIRSDSSDVEMWARIAASYDIYSHPEATAIYYSSPLSYGPQSLINRSTKEIIADWDNLNEHIASVQPTAEARDAFLKRCANNAAGRYLPIIKANIRARKIKNTIVAIFFMIQTKNGPSTLGKFIASNFKKLKR